MYIAERTLTIVQGLLKRYGPSSAKKVLWDKEFSTGHWDFIDNTPEDCIYPHLQKYSARGAILDLGCGPGNTANELEDNAYQAYVGVDISQVALDKGRRRSEATGRAHKNHFLLHDILSYEPSGLFNIILFRESLYHIPLTKLKDILDRYSRYLAVNGVVIIRLATFSGGKIRSRLRAMIEVIEKHYDILEQCQYGSVGPTVIVFRPRTPSKDTRKVLKT